MLDCCHFPTYYGRGVFFAAKLEVCGALTAILSLERVGIVESCADENANIIYGQIVDESMGDAVRITVIATGFANNQNNYSAPKRDYSRQDLFASTTQTSAATASAALNPAPSPASSTGLSGQQYGRTSAPARTNVSTGGRINDEDYIPDFLRRQR